MVSDLDLVSLPAIIFSLFRFEFMMSSSPRTTSPVASGSMALAPHGRSTCSTTLPPAAAPVYELPPQLLLLQLLQPPDALPAQRRRLRLGCRLGQCPTKTDGSPCQRDGWRQSGAHCPEHPWAARCAESTTRGHAEAGAASCTYVTSAWEGTRHSTATTPRDDDSYGKTHIRCRRMDTAYPDHMHTHMYPRHVTWYAISIASVLALHTLQIITSNN